MDMLIGKSLMRGNGSRTMSHYELVNQGRWFLVVSTSEAQREKRQLLWLTRYSSRELFPATQRFLRRLGLWMSGTVGTDLERDIFGSSCRL